VQFSPNPLIRRKINRIGLIQVGDISWPEHVGIFTIPVRAAVQYNIPLIIWGENSQNEYGGPVTASDNNILNRRWLEGWDAQRSGVSACRRSTEAWTLWHASRACRGAGLQAG
jgi:hypothetical protein